MNKSQVVLIFIAIGMSVLLYSLPKGIIKKEKDDIGPKENTVHTGGNDISDNDAHKPVIESNENNKIIYLTKQLNLVSNDKKVTFADSLAVYYRKLHFYDSAAKYAGIAVEFKPDDVHLLKAADYNFEAYSFSENASKATFNTKAQKFYNLILKKSPKNFEVRSKLAMTYVGGENTMEGIRILKSVLEEDPKNETAMYQLGILSLQSGQNDKAIERFKNLIEIYPSNANAHFYLGVGYMNVGKKEKARQSLEQSKLMEKDPAFQAAVDDYLKELNK